MGSRALLVLRQDSNICTTNSQSNYRCNYEDFYNEHYPNRSDHGGHEEKVLEPLRGFTSHQPASASPFTGTLPVYDDDNSNNNTNNNDNNTGHIHQQSELDLRSHPTTCAVRHSASCLSVCGPPRAQLTHRCELILSSLHNH